MGEIKLLDSVILEGKSIKYDKSIHGAPPRPKDKLKYSNFKPNITPADIERTTDKSFFQKNEILSNKVRAIFKRRDPK